MTDSAQSPPRYSLRDATAGDLPVVGRINNENTPAVSPADADKFRWYLDNCAYFRVAIDANGEVVGFLNAMAPGAGYWSENYKYFLERGGDFLYIDRVAVGAAHRRSGLGRLFYEDAERYARDAGLGAITCEVNVRPRNEPSLRFHDAMGFRGIEERDTAYGPRVLMYEKVL